MFRVAPSGMWPPQDRAAGSTESAKPTLFVGTKRALGDVPLPIV